MLPRTMLTAWLALFALVQVALPTTAARGECSLLGMGADDCCCVDGGSVARPEPSCCGSEEPDPAPLDDEDCECAALPNPAPVAPVEAPDLSSACADPALVAPLRLAVPLRASAVSRLVARARAPGGGPPLRLLHGVFRL